MKYGKLACGILLSSILLVGCGNKEKDVSVVNGKEYDVHELADLVGNYEDVSSINDAILYTILDNNTTKKQEKEASNIAEAGKEANPEASEEDVETAKNMYLRNLVLQDYYKKYVKVSSADVDKMYKDGYKKSEFIQAVSLGELTEDLSKYIKEEVSKVVDEKSAEAFYNFYAEDTHEEIELTKEQKIEMKKYNFNSKIKNVLSVDKINLTTGVAEGVFDDAMDLKPYKHELIGKDSYGGYLIKLSDTKLSKKEINEDYFYTKVQKEGYYSTATLLNKIDKEQQDVEFSPKAQKAIKDSWNDYLTELEETTE